MDELIPLVQAETGATQRVASTMQVPTCIERFRRYAKGALEPSVIPLPPSEMPATALASGGLMGAMVVRQPVGVVACITPYNFPIVNMAGKIGPALAMGNTVVVKPAPQDPLAVTVFGEVLHDAGLPAGRRQRRHRLEPGGRARPSSRPTHVDMVSFTGSTPVGRAIGEVAGRDMKRLLLELGGKGAGIVFDDADLKTAIGTIASVWAFHSGQICTAPTRVIAQRGVYDQVVAGLQQAAGRLKVGDPLEPDTVVGPLISDVQRGRVEALIKTGVEQGGELVAGGERPDMATGFYVAPTLIAGCKPDNAAVQQEFFGPVVVVVPFDDEDEAVAIANGTEFGLYDYVFTRRHDPRPARGQAAAHRQRRPQHRAAQPRGALRRLQDERRRPRRRQLRPARLQRAAVHRLAGLTLARSVADQGTFDSGGATGAGLTLNP